MRAPETLFLLAQATDEALQGLGVPSEARSFSPHITVARIKEANPLIELKRTIAALPSRGFRHLYGAELCALRKLSGGGWIGLYSSSRLSFCLKMIPFLVLAAAYLIGGIPFGYLLVKLKTGKDVRSAGSGNIGATNVLRTTGR